MTSTLAIENFKSIKSLNLECKRVNVLIGEPNSGKSNIIEALSLLSQNVFDESVFEAVFRIKSMADFFYDSNVNDRVDIKMDGVEAHIEYPKNVNGVQLNVFRISVDQIPPEAPFNNPQFQQTFEHNGKVANANGMFNTRIKLYQYKRNKSFSTNGFSFLSPPFGENLPGVLLTNPEMRKWVSDFLRSKGYRIQLRPVENDLSIAKEVDDELYSYPFFTISETLQRVIFMHTAIETNNNAILLFDEPEANTFPFYTKFIAERIGLNASNQFFLTTHNPYLLMSLIQKTPSIDLNLCITEMKNYETVVHSLSREQIEKVIGYGEDVFYNLERVLEI